ncbi:O-antigen ligase family protein [Arcobacter porcinus]|uniref:O-Antigen ligase n=1 Tax=Arcobacter porcinus TaxID=1935204 RepID=A0ABX2YA12_9BACT|nr:O-antigen ligase family protein [Arcobacter porcinus]OCL89938.1 O-Antigen ligase [Arcobacter porcinus]
MINFKFMKIDYSKNINYFIVLYAFCLPITRAGVTFSTIVLILLWILEGDYKRKIQEIKDNYIILSIFIFVLYSLLAVLWSEDYSFALGVIKKYYHFLIIPIILTSLKQRYIENVFSAFLIAMLISEFTSYSVFFGIISIEGISRMDPSPFMIRTDYSLYLAFTVFILMHKIIYTTDLKWKIAFFLYFSVSIGNLFLNAGRVGQISFLITLLILGILNFKKKILSTIIFLFLGIVIFITSYNVSPIFKQRFDYLLIDVSKMVYENDYSNSFSTRVALWISGIKGSKDNLIFGIGIGDEYISTKKSIEQFKVEHFPNSKTENYVNFHSAYIQHLVQIGVIGLFLFLFIFYCFIKLEINNKYYKNLLIVFVILSLLFSITGQSFSIQRFLVLFALFCGLFSSISKYERIDK